MTKKIFLPIYFILIIVFFLQVVLVYAAIPHLELSPSSGNITTSGTSVAVKIDTGGQEATSARAVINFDATKLEVVSIQAGTFFDDVTHNIYNSTGQVVINASRSPSSSLESKTGIGTLATMIVKAKTSSGTVNMTFDCTSGSSTDSGINDPTPTDIIDCTANVNGSYNLGVAIGGASPSPSLSPTSTPSALPTAGNTTPTIMLLSLGFCLTIFSLPLFVFVKK
jgi:hypothetical protein